MKEVVRDPMFRFLAILSIASTAGHQAWRNLFNNFAVEVVGLAGDQVGMIQSVREIPGLLSLLAIFLFLVMKEHRVSLLAIAALGAGLCLTGFFPTYAGIIITTLIMSFGFHYYETTNQSLTLQYFDEDTSPWVFGKFRSYAAAANIAVGGLILLLSVFLAYKVIYLLIGLAVLATAVWGTRQQPTRADTVPQRQQMVFRKRYGLYYFLTFLSGARRQIFVAFAVFLLVEKFAFSIQEITILFIVNNLVNYFLSPLIGLWIIRFGERRVLSIEYFSLIFIFVAYAYVESRWLVAILYIVDHIFFNFSIAIRTFFQKIGDPRDFAPTMAVGFTINHIAAVVIPALGGILWVWDYRIPFLAAAALSVVSLIAAQWVLVDTKIDE